MKIGIFCSANEQIDPDFFRMTEELGQWMGRNGHTVVFGGCNLGLMECVAKAAREAGGRTIGVIPTKVEKDGHVSEQIDVSIACDNLSDRKDLMLAHSDVCIALPGGIGTLDEVFTVAASNCIGYHAKRVILYDMKGFWKPLTTLLDTLKQQGFIRGDYQRQILTAHDLPELISLL